VARATIDEKWSKAVRNLHGMYTRGFPLILVGWWRTIGTDVETSPSCGRTSTSPLAAVVRAQCCKTASKAWRPSSGPKDRWVPRTIVAKSKVNLDYIRELYAEASTTERVTGQMGKLIILTRLRGRAIAYFGHSYGLAKRAAFLEDWTLTRE